MKSKALFLDRDGTIIEDCGYVSRPEDVRLLPGAADAIRRAADAGHRIIIVSNQSGVARGIFDEKALAAVHDRVEELLRAEGGVIDAAYYCPYLDGPAATEEAFRRDSDLRKPKPGMLVQAAEELDVDLSRSWMVGDSVRDIEAGAAAGCRTVLIGNSADESVNGVQPDHRARDLSEAVALLERGRASKPMASTMEDIPSERSGGEQSSRQLQKIHDLLERTYRRDRQNDFSLLRLFGSLLQMAAIVVALWGLSSMMQDESAIAGTRFMLACFLQLAVMTSFAIDHFR